MATASCSPAAIRDNETAPMIDAILLFREALYGALVIGVTCAVLGVYVVLRRIVFVGAALAQLSSAGIALSLWIAGLGLFGATGLHDTAFALALATLGALFFALGGGRSRVPPDAIIGVTYALAAAWGIILVAKAATGEAHDIFLQGNILGITRKDTLVLLAVSLPVLLTHTLLYKEFLFVSFDPETAQTLGLSVRGWTLLLYLTLGLVIAFAMRFAGVLLVFNYLVLPAVTALFLARSMARTFTLAILAAVVATVLGFGLSIPLDLPSGPAIVAMSGLLALAAAVLKGKR